MSMFPSLVRFDYKANALCTLLRGKESRASKELSCFFRPKNYRCKSFNFHSFVNSISKKKRMFCLEILLAWLHV